MTQAPDELNTADIATAIALMSNRHWQLSCERQASNIRVALAQNIAMNGRLFCCLLAAANFSVGWHFGVAYAAVPVACAWLSDLTDRPYLKRSMAHSSIVTATILAIATLLKCW
ncbi:MAG: hypothetical protein EOQ34_30080 [Mesorhizobium sp.]|nr:hypothetical protein [Mesorhizobium sp.]RWF63915.1 MAG: hypothetical protein EOQ34_30080 [Mesorhizobium sp.]